MFDNPGANRVKVNVSAQLKQVCFFVHDQRFVSALKKVARPSMPPIELIRVMRLRVVHECCEIRAGCFDENVVVVVHQNVTEYPDAETLRVHLKLLG